MENLEATQQPEKKDSAEEFFADRVDVLQVTKEEFLQMVKNKYPEMSDEEILQTKGINFDQEGRVVVLLRTDAFPQEYMLYIETHEKWEAYMARKEGYNLFRKAKREYKEDKQIDSFDEERKKQFYKDLSVYNYEFRHEYAIYKEYQQAMNDGKLEEYHKWVMGLREKEKETNDPVVLTLITNDIEIRESIYRKLKEGTKHHFLKK